MNTRQFITAFCSFTAFCLLSIFLYWHYELGLTRYFDVDEFAHLSWAFQMFSGRRPYVDFLFFFPPGFHLFLMPLFAFGSGVAPILSARVFAFIIFVLLIVVTMFLFWLVRRSWTAILAGVFLAFLPMPFDKFLEIRPDTLAVLFAMVGMICQIWALGGKRKRFLLLAGVSYGISILILPKTLPQVGVALGVEGLRFLMNRKEDRQVLRLKNMVIGLAIPLTLFALWTLTLGNIDQVLYSLTKLPVEANKISQTFIMMPDLFFYPNVTFYGSAGWGTGLVVNHAMWVIAIFIGVYRLFAPFLARVSKPNQDIPTLRLSRHVLASSLRLRSGQARTFTPSLFEGMLRNGSLSGVDASPASDVWTEFLIAATFFTYVIFYVQIVPLKHTQYLIPIAVFIAFYAADCVDMLWRKSVELSKNHAHLLPIGVFLALFIAGSIRIMQVFVAVNEPKRAWTNADTIKNLTALYTTIPTGEYILDLTGETLYYKQPYVVCCTPFGQSAPYLSRPLPSLIKALEKTKTKYIFQGGVKRVTTLLPGDQSYIAAHYQPSPTIGGLLIRK